MMSTDTGSAQSARSSRLPAFKNGLQHDMQLQVDRVITVHDSSNRRNSTKRLESEIIDVTGE